MKSLIILIFISLFVNPTLQSNNENTTNESIVDTKSSFRVWLDYFLYRICTTDMKVGIQRAYYQAIQYIQTFSSKH